MYQHLSLEQVERVYQVAVRELNPNPHVLADAGAKGFDIKAGETRSGLWLYIPPPVMHAIRGQVIGDLPGEGANTT